ncbi:hypothetical protein DAT71_24695, partial [Salmonella enterica subsp. enterica serovar Enteritidis]|nr:hypothetical protein [Salmonella enterica subsp. enterica serovar Enteritidis]
MNGLRLSMIVALKNMLKVLLIIIKALRVNRAGWKNLLIITGNVIKGERSVACPLAFNGGDI